MIQLAPPQYFSRFVTVRTSAVTLAVQIALNWNTRRYVDVFRRARNACVPAFARHVYDVNRARKT